MAPCVGALLGTLVYLLMIEIHHPPDTSPAQTAHQRDEDSAEGGAGLELQQVETEKKAAA